MRYSQSSVTTSTSPTLTATTVTTTKNTPTIPIATIRSNQYPKKNISSLSITIPPYIKHPYNHNQHNNTTTLSFPYPSLLHTIHVTNVLSPSEVQHCLLLAQQYAQQTKCWETPDVHRHASYATCDFPIDDCIPLQQYLDDDTVQFDTRIFQLLQTFFRIPSERMYYIDLFCAQYTAATPSTTTAATNTTVDTTTSTTTTTTTTMDRLGSHRDGSILSFTITLTEPNMDFMGGGTYFEALQNVTTTTMTTNTTVLDETDHSNSTNNSTNITNDIESIFQNGTIRPLQRGDGVFHCGKLLHGASPITYGTRIVLVGFVDVMDERDNDNDLPPSSILRPGRIHTACRDWGRLDVATYQYQRQQQLNRQRQQKESRTFSPQQFNNKSNIYRRSEQSKRWIPSHHCLRNIRPLYIHHSNKVGRDILWQRQRRLEIEDQLLRSVLLSSSLVQDDNDDEHNRRKLNRWDLDDHNNNNHSQPNWDGFLDNDITIL